MACEVGALHHWLLLLFFEEFPNIFCNKNENKSIMFIAYLKKKNSTFNLQVLPTSTHFLPTPYMQILLMVGICELLTLARKPRQQPRQSKYLRLPSIKGRRIILVKLLSTKEQQGWLRRTKWRYRCSTSRSYSNIIHKMWFHH